MPPDDPLTAVTARYAVATTATVRAAMVAGDPHDPVARQYLPDVRELETLPEELADPIGDELHSPVPGIVHRYRDRVLFKVTSICAVYCRFCFRREMVGPNGEKPLDDAAMERALAYIADHPEIWEVILTGGDPLVLSARRLAAIVARLNAIDHVRIIRIHTRIPVADPERVDDELIAALKGRCPVYVLVHCNHANEFTASARAACARLVDAGIPLLSQSVLLKGVNDDVETLAALMRAFVENRIKPHYIHHPDMAPGTGHFRLPPISGMELMRDLREKYSGLCQPTYILETPGGEGKRPLFPSPPPE